MRKATGAEDELAWLIPALDPAAGVIVPAFADLPRIFVELKKSAFKESLAEPGAAVAQLTIRLRIAKDLQKRLKKEGYKRYGATPAPVIRAEIQELICYYEQLIGYLQIKSHI